MTTSPQISAVICTYNRCHLLADTIESLIAQSLDPALYEIVIVDNASTDDTAAVVTECQQKFAAHNIRLIHEETPGLSHARNTGFHAARGRYVAYLDDDALAATQWLEAGIDSFESTCDPCPVAVVGPVFPRYPDGKPHWFNDQFETYDLGIASFRLSDRQSFMGGNSMFEKSVLEELGGFDPRLGMTGDRLWLGEEVELLMRMRKRLGSDCAVVYDPRVKILHAISRDKLKAGYVLKRRFLNGQCRFLMELQIGNSNRIRCALTSLAWIAWLSVRACVSIVRHRHLCSWVTERGAPVMVHAGMLIANLCYRTANAPGNETATDDEGLVPRSKAA
jgi:glycosyltransferase involved in cell wall biosynthesis